MPSQYCEWLTSAWDNPKSALDNTPPPTIVPHWRLIKTFAEEGYSYLDLASLFRSVVRYETLRDPHEIAIGIPSSIANNFNEEICSLVSLQAIRSTGSETFYTASPWSPDWLPNSHLLPEKAALDLKLRRKESPVPGDPILSHIGMQDYRSKAQKEALRSVFCASPGETIVINLPTGSGKSLCAFLPSLFPLSAEDNLIGVTLIIVPTISLALDMAQKLEPIVGHKVAYRHESKDEARDIRSRCKSGFQGPVIVSPESMVGGLYRVILEASRKNLVKYFVVDEAHMALSWGDEFRPAFQQLAAIRRKLLAECDEHSQFVTLLLSATLTEYHLSWLKEMFSDNESFSIIHAAKLRPEPSYWQAKAPSSEDRREWILEALYHLPKPIILYSVRRESTQDWYACLRDKGFSRVGMIHGGSSESDRRNQINKWNADEIDIMIATSAFGLGVDKPDVKGVIHAEAPETVDRFYQDVGRGGRGGYGSVSLMCWTDTDLNIIKNIQSPSFIGVERGRHRWKKMFDNKKVVDSANLIYSVATETRAEMDMENDLNRLWNIRTLLLLDRAKIIRIEASRNASRNIVDVKILHDGHTESQVWEDKIQQLRDSLKNEYAKANELLERILDPQECLSDIFSDCYKSEKFNIPVVKACGGCPCCRSNSISPFQGRIIARRFVGDNIHSINKPEFLGSIMNNHKVFSIFCPDDESEEIRINNHMQIIQWVLDKEKANIIAYPGLTNRLIEKTRQNPQWIYFLDEEPIKGVAEVFPSIYFLHNPLPIWWPKLWEELEDSNKINVLVLPIHLVTPNHSGRLVRDVIPGKKIEYKSWEDRYIE